MAKGNPGARSAAKLFDSMCQQADRLAADESTHEVPSGILPEDVASDWKQKAGRARQHLSGCSGSMAKKNKALTTCLLFTEIHRAETPELVFERFHARRDEIETLLTELS